MRGKVCCTGLYHLRDGITPALAGKRTKAVGSCRWCKDHPRVCREKLGLFTIQHDLIGSPPRMRGKAFWMNTLYSPFGITPAYAGKRVAPICRYTTRWDHPRVCGEKRQSKPPPSLSWGSPPHLRGKDVFGILGNVGSGITPAYAGKRRSSLAGSAAREDHPRVCGEKSIGNTPGS